MLKINRKTEYALIVLKHMQDQGLGAQSTAREICDHYRIPFDTTSKVMQTMAHSEILISMQGHRGGYSLSKTLGDINYYEFTQIIEGRDLGTNCEQLGCNLLESCNITGPVKKLNNYLLYFFKGLTLGDLLAENEIGPLLDLRP